MFRRVFQLLAITGVCLVFGQGRISFPQGVPKNLFEFTADILDKSEHNVYYDTTIIGNPKKPNSPQKTITILQLGKEYTKFLDYNSIRMDSANVVLRNKEHVSDDDVNKLFAFRSIWKGILLKKKNDNKNLIIDRAFKGYEYQEPQPTFNWKLQPQTKKILGYDCQMATTSYRGRDYEAWYATELPINSGPYVFQGLPGLILELKDAKDQYHFVAIGLDKKPRDIYQKTSEKLLRVTRDQFRKAARDYHNNPEFFMSGQAYNADGTEMKMPVGKTLPYNPIELE